MDVGGGSASVGEKKRLGVRDVTASPRYLSNIILLIRRDRYNYNDTFVHLKAMPI